MVIIQGVYRPSYIIIQLFIAISWYLPLVLTLIGVDEKSVCRNIFESDVI